MKEWIFNIHSFLFEYMVRLSARAGNARPSESKMDFGFFENGFPSCGQNRKILFIIN